MNKLLKIIINFPIKEASKVLVYYFERKCKNLLSIERTDSKPVAQNKTQSNYTIFIKKSDMFLKVTTTLCLL